MTPRLVIAFAFAVITASPGRSPAIALEICTDKCSAAGAAAPIDQYGKAYCSRAGGGVARDQYGSVVCGIGYCAVDDEGRVKCSSIPAGGATMDSHGKVEMCRRMPGRLAATLRRSDTCAVASGSAPPAQSQLA